MLRSSIQNELDNFFKIRDAIDIPRRVVTGSAFGKARKKLKHEAFLELNSETVRHFYDTYPVNKWEGFRLLAIDGSTVKVPKTEDCRNQFGELVGNRGAPCPMARISQLFDVLNHITIEARIECLNTGERELAASHINLLEEDDLVLLDRGYPAFWLFNAIIAKGSDFCARISSQFAPEVMSDFLESGKNEDVVTLTPSPATRSKCRKRNLPCDPLKVRMIRIDTDGAADPEVLVTSLTDRERYPHGCFADLYHNRWPVEEDYKLHKCRIEIENFTGKSAETAKQDFYARVFSCNLTSILAFPVHDQIKAQTGHRKFIYKINWTQALAKMRNCGILVFFRERVETIITKIQTLFLQNVSPLRPGRSFPRKHRVSNKFHAFSYKPIS